MHSYCTIDRYDNISNVLRAYCYNLNHLLQIRWTFYHSIFKYQFRLQCKLSFASLDAARAVFAWKKVQRCWRETQESRNISKFHGKSNSNHSMQFIAFFRMISFQMEYFIENQCILVSIEFAIHFHFFFNLIDALLWSYHHFIGKHSGSPVSLTNYKNVNFHIFFPLLCFVNHFFRNVMWNRIKIYLLIVRIMFAMENLHIRLHVCMRVHVNIQRNGVF